MHRDTKLANILVAEHRLAQILDFGLVKGGSLPNESD
jgi:serine/threonine protein kinase